MMREAFDFPRRLSNYLVVGIDSQFRKVLGEIRNCQDAVFEMGSVPNKIGDVKELRKIYEDLNYLMGSGIVLDADNIRTRMNREISELEINAVADEHDKISN